MMDERDRDAIVTLYSERLRRLGRSHRTVGWGSAADQELRFEQLFRGTDPRGGRVLDLGCGLGDLVPFLDARTGGDYEYLGVDLAPDLVVAAEDAYGGPRRRFVVGDIGDLVLAESFSHVVCSGALSFRIVDNEAVARRTIAAAFQRADVLTAFNFLTSYADFQLEKNFHYSPEEMFRYARTLTPRVALYHDYPLWEFTLQLRREKRNP